MRVSRTVKDKLFPLLCTMALIASAPVTGTPLAATITSPGSIPAFWAGLSGWTPTTFIPVRLPIVTGSAETPKERPVTVGAGLVASLGRTGVSGLSA